MRHHLYDLRWSLLILLALLVGLGVAWGGDITQVTDDGNVTTTQGLFTWPKYYLVDWEKVKTFEDLRLILSVFNFAIREDHEGLEKVRHLLKEEGR